MSSGRFCVTQLNKNNNSNSMLQIWDTEGKLGKPQKLVFSLLFPALLKQISPFDTASVMTNIYSFNSNDFFLRIIGQTRDIA